jgi:tetratricopeptide (TPR) repeat protein
MLCWLSVLYLLVAAWKGMQAGESSEPEFMRGIRALARRVAVPVCVLVLVAYPMARQLRRDSRPPERLDGDRALRSIRVQQFSEVSSKLYSANRYREAILAASQALALDPNDAEAHVQVAASSAALSLWDQAIESARQALRVQPESSQAQKILSWALQARQKENPYGQR